MEQFGQGEPGVVTGTSAIQKMNDYVKTQFQDYFMKAGYEKFEARATAFFTEFPAKRSGKVFDVLSVEIVNQKAPDSSFDSTPYRITAVLKGTSPDGSVTEVEMKGNAVISKDELIKEIKFRATSEFQEYVTTE
ncbi:hypothetical protein [Indiicoccus explosivorum]|uniref:hypothetical protein n=1 Tax=Indiicoccus explosivorum TaxID=1917864 RepID=UPI000B431A24|nr:hypothetical protein [Indiicoccus explosivorum]